MAKYVNLEAVSRDEAENELASGDPERIGEALIRLVLFDPDGPFLRDLIFKHLQHRDSWVRGIAATSASHLVRLHRDLDLSVIRDHLQWMRGVEDEKTRGRVEDALGDFSVFRPRR